MTENQAKNRIVSFLAAGVLLVFIGAAASALYSGFVPVEKEILAPINWDSQPGWTVPDPPVTSLSIKVSGPVNALADLCGFTYNPGIDYSEEGVVSLPVEFASGDMPKGVEVLSVTPAELNYRVERLIKKEVFVILEYAGQPAGGYTITELQVEPQRVRLAGAMSQLKDVETVATFPVDVSRAKESITAEIPLALSESVARSSGSKTVTATIVIDEEKAVRRVTVPVQGKNPPGRFTITPSVIELVVKGPVQDLDDLPHNGKMASWVDMKGMAPGVYARRAVIALPLSVTLQDASPEVFTVHIR